MRKTLSCCKYPVFWHWKWTQAEEALRIQTSHEPGATALDTNTWYHWGNGSLIVQQTENNLLRRAPHSVLEYHIRFGVLSENSISDSDKHQKGPILILNSFHWCHHASYTCVFVAIVVCTNVENNVDVHAMWRHLHKGAWRTGRIFWTMYFPAVRFLFKPFIRQGYALNREGFPL
jgi:hypothetical protein